MSIWAHTLVKNEERYLWYAVMSVIDYIDRILIWDTGSTDNTVDIIKEIQKIHSDKVDFMEVGEVDINQFTVVRQKMLEKTDSDWFMIIDGDEVWWEDSISEITKLIVDQGKNLDSIVSKNYNIVGDIFHYQEERAGMYEIGGVKGHINIRAMNRGIPGISFKRPHGQQGIFDNKGISLQDRDKKKRIFLRNPGYLHFTNMIRSSGLNEDVRVPKRKIKFKYDLGIPFPSDFYYPEIFFKSRPSLVNSVWIKRDEYYKQVSRVYQPIKYLKRRILKYGKTGY